MSATVECGVIQDWIDAYNAGGDDKFTQAFFADLIANYVSVAMRSEEDAA